MGRMVTAAAACVLLAFTPLASGQGSEPARQKASLRFTTEEPGAPTGTVIELEFVNPADPAEKPHAVSRLTISTPPGAAVDFDAIEQCRASDAELETRGAAACPEGSRLGSGTIVSDTGSDSGAPPRNFENRLETFNNEGEVVGIADATTLPPVPGFSRIVTRSPIEGNTTTLTFPALPGNPPPDSFTAIKTMRLESGARGTPARPYLRTPPTCPESGRWTASFSFEYRDGVTQRVESYLPCRRAPAADRDPPTIRIAGLPRRRCARSPFNVRVRARDASPIRRLGIRLDGRLLRAVRRRFARAKIPVRRLRPGRHRVVVRARDAAGNRARRTLRFRRCT